MVFRNTKPKHGDNVDIQHSLYAGCSTLFVTSDTHFLEQLKQINEKDVIFVSLSEFIKKLKEY